jgi:hypothetical protein
MGEAGVSEALVAHRVEEGDGSGAGGAGADANAVEGADGADEAAARGDEDFVGATEFVEGDRADLGPKAGLAREAQGVGAGDAVENRRVVVDRRRDQGRTEESEDVGVCAFADVAVAMENRLVRAAAVGLEEGEDVAHEADRLDLAEPPAEVFHGDRADDGRFAEAFKRFAGGDRGEDRRSELRRRHVGPRRSAAAGDLKVDRGVVEIVGVEDAIADGAQLVGVEPADAGEAEAAAKAFDVKVKGDAVAPPSAARSGADEAHQLVDAVAKEESAIEDADRRGRLLDEPAVQPDQSFSQGLGPFS